MPAPLGVAAGGLALFMALLGAILLRAQPLTLFGARRGRRQHRLCGLVYLGWLAAGLADLWLDCLHRPAFDVSLPCVGLVLTLTAARDFGSESARGEQKVQQPASGPLDETAVVSRSEMLEHSFYQGLNIAQALYLHAHAHAATGTDQPPLSSWAGGVLLALATLPWCWRQRFPVNHFSANWSGTPKTWTAWLYRIKKWQYLLYKHCLLHGLNLSVALPGSLLGSGGGGAAGSVRVAHTRHWQLYWLSLNSAYVMEFFLQTLVRKKQLAQRQMLRMNQLLMVISTVAAVQLLQHVHPLLAGLSLLLNFAHRGHDFANTMAVLGGGHALRLMLGGDAGGG